MARYLLLLLLTLSSFGGFAQVLWQKCLGGGHYDKASAIKNTFDSGYIVAGDAGSDDGDLTVNYGDGDGWLVKLDKSGDIQWHSNIGGSGDDRYYDVCQTTDSGYIAVGFTGSNDIDISGNHGSNDVWVVKFTQTGVVAWKKCFGGSGSDVGHSVAQTTDGGYVIVGYTTSVDGDVTGNHGSWDAWVIKLSDTGVMQWARCFGGSDDEIADAVLQAADGGYILAAHTLSNDGDVSGFHEGLSWDGWLVKLTAAGNIVWQKCLGGIGSDVLSDIKLTNDGGYILAASSTSNNGDVIGDRGKTDADFWVVKISVLGDIQWQRSYGGLSFDWAESIQQTTDGGFVVAGSTVSTDLQGFHYEPDKPRSAEYWIDIYVVKISAIGDWEWQKVLGGNERDYGWDIIQTTDGGYIVAGSAENNGGDISGNHSPVADAWLVKLGQRTGIPTVTQMSKVSVSPNPATGMVTVVGAGVSAIMLTDVAGHTILKVTHTDRVSIAHLDPGTYIISLLNDQGELIHAEQLIKQ